MSTGPTTSAYVTRLYEAGDEIAIVELLERVFDGWPHFDLPCDSVEHWRWKFLDNPQGYTLVSVTERDGELLGCTHKLPIPLWLDGQAGRGNIGADLALHPDHRGRDVSNPLRTHNRELARQYDHLLSWFVSLSPIVQKTYARTGLRFPCRVAAFVRVRDVGAQLRAMPMRNAWVSRLGFLAANTLNQLHRAVRPAPVGSELDVSEIDHFDDDVEALCAAARGQHLLMVNRSREYLDWRYCDPRAGGFSVREVRERGSLLGYCVLKINRYRRDYPTGFVLDLLTLPDRLDAADALLTDAIRYFDAEDVNLASACAVRGHPHQRVLARHGFLDSRRELPLYFGRTTRPDETGVADVVAGLRPSDVHFCYGDLDTLPVSVSPVARPHTGARTQ